MSSGHDTDFIFKRIIMAAMVWRWHAGPHKLWLWVNVGTGWRKEPEGQLVHTGTVAAVMARRKARQRA